ncbi:MAG: DNA topoisomerase III [Bacteroidales bacterium]|nr:DNA topoisomerase III [Candidatus Physcousia equi]
MIVCIAEKQSVAQIYANVLGATAQHQGFFEGNGYQVTWTFGHLCELKEPNDYFTHWRQWSLGYLPMIPPRFGIKLKDDERVKRQFAIIKDLFLKADLIINGGDAGQEGELIQRWVLQMTGAKCPVKRLWVSSMTEEAIRDAFSKMKDQEDYQKLYEAGLARAIGDWLLGMNATRLYTIKYGRGRAAAKADTAPDATHKNSRTASNQTAQRATGSVLSIGRVQTPTLALIVKRQLEIEHFVPRQSWVLSTLYRDIKFSAITRDEEAEAEDAAQVAEAARLGKTLKPKGPIYKTLEYDTEQQGKDILDAIKNNSFTVTNVSKKRGTEAPPRLYDLTSLQVDCNRKFGFSADQTLQLIQSLYEKKFTTYPRVDTTYLPEDVYSTCPGIMNGLYKTRFGNTAPYADLIRPLGGGKQLRKSKKVFDTSKVTDHHAIIPTGVTPYGLTEFEQKVFDLVARAFIAAFYDDCKFETTTVFGTVPTTIDADKLVAPTATEILFRTSGKVITDEGWKVVYKKANNETPSPLSEATLLGKDDHAADATAQARDGNQADATTSGILPIFSKGEQGPHVPSLAEKWTTPPKPYTEATILRAMETAGRFVDDAELREAMKENGIGRPSTRAAIIETLVRRHYIRRERKTLVATPTGIDLIATINEELLKSAELTGRWEKKLRQIEHGQYDTAAFIAELKEMVTDIVRQVLSDNSNHTID